MKFAIIQTSGKQFLIQPNKWYDINFISNTTVGAYIQFNKVLLFKDSTRIQIGKPFLFNSIILATIIDQVKGSKIIVLKTKPKKKYTRIYGHRQLYTRIQINS